MMFNKEYVVELFKKVWVMTGFRPMSELKKPAGKDDVVAAGCCVVLAAIFMYLLYLAFELF